MNVSQHIIDAIKELGNQLDDNLIEATVGLYLPLYEQTAASDAALVITHKDYRYGDNPLQMLDVYQPTKALAGAHPILIYIHGGGFISGEKANHANLGNYFAKHGILFIAADYRLAPDFTYPAGAQDVAGVVDWALREAAQFNGNLQSIFVMGHSAGVSHVADYASGAAGAVAPSVRGIMLISGSAYDLSTLAPHHVYYGALQHDSARSLIHNIDRLSMPVFAAFAEYEPERIAIQNKVFAKALLHADLPVYPIIKFVLQHNHVSIMKAINTGDESLGLDLVGFIRRYTAD